MSKMSPRPDKNAMPAVRDGRPSVDSLQVGDGIVVADTRWSFAGATPQRFDAHVNKSVPLYAEGHQVIASAAEFFVRPGGKAVDVGCSTGTLLRLLADRMPDPNIDFVGVDLERDMVQIARERCLDYPNIEILQSEASVVDYANSDVVIMYYTLQFLKPVQRELVLRRIYDGLRVGGALFLYEKTLAPDAKLQDLSNQLYMDFKLQNGFNVDEIFSKAKSLRGVMEPCSSKVNHTLLSEIGFPSVMTIHKYLSFEGILAIK